MNIALAPDYPVTDDACQAATGKTLAEWSELIAGNPDIANKRRDAINWIFEQTSRTVEMFWWSTTAWVEHERRISRVQKDGRVEGYNLCSTKTIAAPIDAVLAAVKDEIAYGEITRVREGKDIRAKWKTPGVDTETDVDVVFSDKGKGKTGIVVNHNRIQTRDEADGLRRAWAETLDAVKKQLEA